jgi:hypothetical protein
VGYWCSLIINAKLEIFLAYTDLWKAFNGPRFKKAKLVFAKLKNFFAKLIFFPPKFFLLGWREKINLAKKFFNVAKKVGPLKK